MSITPVKQIANHKSLLVLVLVALFFLPSCNRIHENWPTYTGTSVDGTSANLTFASEQARAGDFSVPAGYSVVGCLAGANESFTLTDANSGTIYRLQANYEELKQFTGELVAVQGNVTANEAGVPVFALCSAALDKKGGCPEGADTRPKTLAVNCPSIAQGGINELNQPPATKSGPTQSVAPPNPQNVPGQPALPAEVTRKP